MQQVPGEVDSLESVFFVEPPITAPVNYNPIEQQQIEINDLQNVGIRLTSDNQDLRRLLQLQAQEHQQFKDEIIRTVTELRQQHQAAIKDLRDSGTTLTRENQDLKRLLQLKAQEQQQFKDEIIRTVTELKQQHQATIKDLHDSKAALVGENQELRRLLQLQIAEQRQLREEVTSNIRDRVQEQQTHKQAISFLYDKFKEASTVAFTTGNCDVHGTRLPIPSGFERQHCKFFTAGLGKHHGSPAWDVIPTFQTSDVMVLPYSGNCDLPGGSYGVWAAKPVISEQELAYKKVEYKLTI